MYNEQKVFHTDPQRFVSTSAILPPQTKSELQVFCDAFLKMHIPDKKICPNHCAPIDYLWHAFSSDSNPGGTALPVPGHGRGLSSSNESRATSHEPRVTSNESATPTAFFGPIAAAEKPSLPPLQLFLIASSNPTARSESSAALWNNPSACTNTF